jgi:Tfp pilus assembly protein PilN
MTAQKKEQINLLSQKGLANSTTGRVLLWVLSTFRIIVIVTEILVMVAFLSRFWLDAQNNDLDDELKQKQAVLSAYSDFESNFVDTQKRLDFYSTLTKDELIASDQLTILSSSLPSDTRLVSISFASNELTIEGLSPSETSIQQFIVNLHKNGEYQTIELNEISTQLETGLLSFKLTIVGKGEKQ